MADELDAGLKPFPKELFVAADGNPIRTFLKYLEDAPVMSSRAWRARVAIQCLRALPTPSRDRMIFDAAHGNPSRAILMYMEDTADDHTRFMAIPCVPS